VSPETARRLESDEVDLHLRENETGAKVFPFLRSDSLNVHELKRQGRLRLRFCVSSGLVSAGKNAFGQWFSGDEESLSDLSSSFAQGCLVRMFPGAPVRPVMAVAKFGVTDAWPAVRDASINSGQAQVFRNWLVGLSY
jgi:hypothetical protein